MKKDDETAVLKVIQDMTEAFHNADIEGVMASYESGATVAFEPGKPVSGNEALRAGFQMFFGFKPHFTYSGHEVMVSGDIAVHFAPWTMQGTGQDGSPIIQSGLSVAVFRRGKDAVWHMVIDNPFGGRLLQS